MVKIRLALHGAKKKPFYKIVVADSRFPRNGRFIENIGFFNPNINQKSKKINLNLNRIDYWIKNGAKMSERIKTIIKKIKKNNFLHNKN
ncbi:30S ribosomal protein S16 [Buchnera aphidicola]|uniref:Small ribosomal subunit protein bS16 n=1 Tax=Buchnera aphidicola (Stegophylla sp.) TaxID=2315800 RepID=A0A4D6YKC4_9GAMM|nr:30S ribosomal protein S16 [Buchnera aphidicola (Stegophylla sp.)]QCI26414.1 30S ribosomal protein S16 [Buchnera aphidicola (Stegophylla sp.)]